MTARGLDLCDCTALWMMSKKVAMRQLRVFGVGLPSVGLLNQRNDAATIARTSFLSIGFMMFFLDPMHSASITALSGDRLWASNP